MKIKKKWLFKLLDWKLNFLLFFSKEKAGKAAFKIFCTPFPTAINSKSSIFDSGESLDFTVNNAIVRGYRFNANQQKKALILHGFSSTCLNFYQYISDLINNDFEVLAFDAPAHGQSEGKQVNALQYSEMIIKIEELYGPIDAYISHSFGGLAVCLALENIKHTIDTKLVLIAPATETTTAIDDAFTFIGVKNEAIKNALKKEIVRISGHSADWFSIRRAIQNIQAKTLWIHDEQDTITPIKDALLVKNDHHKNVEFLITQNLGHRMIYRNETVKNKIISFVSN